MLIFIILLMLMSSVTVHAGPGYYSCPRNRYFDENTKNCHPCTELTNCQHQTRDSLFCDQCAGDKKCPEPKYFDKNTADVCHPCTDCRPGRTLNQYCDAKCSPEARDPPPTVKTIASAHHSTTFQPVPASSSGLSEGSIVAIIVVSIVGLLAFFAAVAYWMFRRRRHDLNTGRHRHCQPTEGDVRTADEAIAFANGHNVHDVENGFPQNGHVTPGLEDISTVCPVQPQCLDLENSHVSNQSGRGRTENNNNLSSLTEDIDDGPPSPSPRRHVSFSDDTFDNEPAARVVGHEPAASRVMAAGSSVPLLQIPAVQESFGICHPEQEEPFTPSKLVPNQIRSYPQFDTRPES